MGKTEDASEGVPEKNGGMLSAVVAVAAQARGLGLGWGACSVREGSSHPSQKEKVTQPSECPIVHQQCKLKHVYW